MKNRVWRRLLQGPSSRSREGGFTVVEIVIAIGIFALVASFTANLLAAGMRGVLLSKRREVANGEATKVLEVARSLSYNSLGLIQSDPTIPTDSAIEVQSGVQKYRVGSSTLEPIIWATSGTGHPFNPHVTEIARGSTSLKRFVYVTGVDSNTDGMIDLKRITVVVEWDSSGTSGTRNSVRAQTLVNPQGVINQAGLIPQTSATSSTGGTATIKSGQGILGQLLNAVLPSTPVTTTLPTTNGGSTFKAITTINCSGKSATISGEDNTYGGRPVSATADDDAQTAIPVTASDSWSGSPADPISGLDDVDDLLVDTAITSPASCSATAADNDGAAPSDDGLPYESGTASGPASLTMTADLTGAGLPSDTLSALALAPQPVSQSVDHQTVGGAREVVSTSSAGQGALSVLKIPSVFSEGLVKVDAMSYSATVRSAEGTPSTAPTVTATNPVGFHIYDPNDALTGCSSRSGGYCHINVNPLAAGFSGINKHVTGSLMLNLGLTKLDFDVQVTALPPASDPVAGVTGPNGERRWSAHYTPVSIDAHLTVTVKVGLIDVVLTDTVVHVDYGTVSASACTGATC